MTPRNAVKIQDGTDYVFVSRTVMIGGKSPVTSLTHGRFMTNIALIGCAHIHTPGFIKNAKARSDAVQVKTVWDHEAARGQARADELGARFIGDLKTILNDPEIKAVAIYSETDRHHDLVVPAAEAKKDLFVEKPLGYSTK